jgi:hypothetical protein
MCWRDGRRLLRGPRSRASHRAARRSRVSPLRASIADAKPAIALCALDANVLFPPLLRDVLLRAAEKGLYQPYWSAKILDEPERALVREGHLDAGAARRARAEIERTNDGKRTRKRRVCRAESVG